MKIAILGSGGREHAIAWKLAQSTPAEHIFVLPGNGGTANNVPIDVQDFEQIKQFCEQENIELIVVGPEAPLAAGITNYFSDSPIKVFGPDQKGAVLESSKIWAKQFMQQYGVATANFWLFDQPSDAQAVIEELNGNLVIKYDGLAGGKGVYVCDSVAEATAALAELVDKYGHKVPFLIEEKLIGPEISIIGITDGQNIQLLTPSQDHKQLLDGDQGPNTGGMGAFCPVPFYNEDWKQQIEAQIVQPTLKGLQSEGFNYKGFIYFGIMLTNSGPKLLEYNVRLGDPETEVILPALKNDLLNLILSCFDGTLSTKTVETNEGYFVDVVLVSGGYPKKYAKGYPISGLDKTSEEVLVFHAGTKQQDGQIVTAGGRVLNVVAHGADLSAAIQKVYDHCEHIQFADVFYRKDIAQRKAVMS